MIQFITHANDRYNYLDGVRIALEGGCRWIQLRMKDASEEEVLKTAESTRKLCRQYDAVFLLDDYVELVERSGADGVHLGKDDMPIDEARRLLGKDKIIGGTANTFEDVKRIYSAGADYIGCGPFRFTTTKKKLSPILGLDAYSRIIKQMNAYGINIPVIAIGGILLQDVSDIMQTGVSGVAISGAILNANNDDNPVTTMKRFINELKSSNK
ncbi:MULTISPECIES: thiamine phosphate synthase [Prevotella]|jgi:thiamine-phosphate diphosphorylase|uniref:thiamine phosphate synthase n=1 Tax=Prevotella melaninogenica TaxID=28132 RepID=UPI001C5D7576|nr:MULTISPECIES: thiamine phosphate synthase [Prevotella]MBF1580117.1 thiamine phosphate synthase [Prevotella sp.]MBF1596010.1 thiamine phosphate synthase [Prevotella sp.]MBF1632941.1 thiamine phosphate synthase [Prevotella sp.]MBW4896055.1 thiamine phosphate synthase [Prevotella melaninogenica]MBW4900166.1 thiamine phosphate synthase [Prevotella melaninogenica]